MYSGVGETREEMTQILILKGASLLLLQALLIISYSSGLSPPKKLYVVLVDTVTYLEMLN